MPNRFDIDYIEECKFQIRHRRGQLKSIAHDIARLEDREREAQAELDRWEANLEQAEMYS